MRLGGSIGRRRGGKRKRRRGRRRRDSIWKKVHLLKTRKVAGLLLLIPSLGFGVGYLMATQLLFPAPEPPRRFVTAPDFRGMEMSEIQEKLEEAGLTLGGADSLRHPAIPAGQIVGQSPLPGQLLLPGGAVRVAVSLGPERREVPDVSRLRGERARAILLATGFSVVVDSMENSAPRGTILQMSPRPGREATLPRIVRLVVSLGPPMVEMPHLVGLGEWEAFRRLDSLGLVVGEIESRLQFWEERFVIEQAPGGWTLVERGSSVRLVLGARREIRRNNPPRNPVEAPGNIW